MSAGGPDASTRRLPRAAARGLPPGGGHYSAYVGPPTQWDFMGATQFRLLTALGLREHHRVLDVGCGGLRAGRLLIPYLDAGGYCGIEPNLWLVEDAIAAEVGPETVARKRARFSDTAGFDPSGFGEAFDFILAQSVFSHAGPDLLALALERLGSALAPGGLMLCTFLCTDRHPGVPVELPGWTYPGCIAYRPETLARAVAAAGLVGRRLPWYHPRQLWHAIARRAEDLPAEAHDRHLTGAVLRAPECAASLAAPAAGAAPAAPGAPAAPAAPAIPADPAAAPAAAAAAEVRPGGRLSPYYDPGWVGREVAAGRHRAMIGGRWDELGRLQLEFLIRRGLRPGHMLLDIGCGSLRLGVRAAAYLEPGGYWGTDLNAELLEAGYAREILPSGLGPRLPRAQLVEDGAFAFPGIPRRIDYAIAASVFTHLPLNHLRLCLARLAAHAEGPCRFYFTLFMPAPGCDPLAANPRGGGIVTHPHQDPYHCTAEDLRHAARGLPWRIGLIGDWGHPFGQQMVEAVRLPGAAPGRPSDGAAGRGMEGAVGQGPGLLVFGRTGQLARELARRLPGGAVFLGRAEADLGDPPACAAAIRAHAPGAVINAAAWTAVDAAETAEAAAHAVNADAPAAMAGECAARGIPFVHVSTDYVFDGSGQAPRRPEDPVAPLSAYGRSKLAGEEGVRAAGGVHAILRTSWVFSAHGTNFVTTMLRLSRTRDRLGVVADQTGGPTPAAALAEAVLAIARALGDRPELSGTYHFAGAPDTTWAGFAREIFRVAGRTVEVQDIPTSAWPTPARRPANSRLDCTTTETAFGIPRPDWRAGLAEVLSELGARP